LAIAHAREDGLVQRDAVNARHVGKAVAGDETDAGCCRGKLAGVPGGGRIARWASGQSAEISIMEYMSWRLSALSCSLR
ncbi:MAG: hypothetical protein AAF385_05795, partial [Pseudomonadota bacterium]